MIHQGRLCRVALKHKSLGMWGHVPPPPTTHKFVWSSRLWSSRLSLEPCLNKILVLRYLAYIVGNYLFIFLEGGGYDGGVVVSLEAHTGILASTAGNCYVTLVIIW